MGVNRVGAPRQCCRISRDAGAGAGLRGGSLQRGTQAGHVLWRLRLCCCLHRHCVLHHDAVAGSPSAQIRHTLATIESTRASTSTCNSVRFCYSSTPKQLRCAEQRVRRQHMAKELQTHAAHLRRITLEAGSQKDSRHAVVSSI